MKKTVQPKQRTLREVDRSPMTPTERRQAEQIVEYYKRKSAEKK